MSNKILIGGVLGAAVYFLYCNVVAPSCPTSASWMFAFVGAGAGVGALL